jgi:DNA-binding response OmpR family regulator
MKILVIPSDPLQLQPLTLRLHSLGIDTVESIDLNQIGEVMAREQPDLILIDGEILGCQVVVKLRQISTASKVPVAFLTEQADPNALSHFLATGVAAIISTFQGWDAVVAEIQRLWMPVATIPSAGSSWLVGGARWGNSCAKKIGRDRPWARSKIGLLAYGRQ